MRFETVLEPSARLCSLQGARLPPYRSAEARPPNLRTPGKAPFDAEPRLQEGPEHKPFNSSLYPGRLALPALRGTVPDSGD